MKIKINLNKIEEITMKKIIILFSITTLFLNAAELPINPVPAIEAPKHNPKSLLKIVNEKVCGKNYEKLETLVQDNNLEQVDLILANNKKIFNANAFVNLFNYVQSDNMIDVFLSRTNYSVNTTNTFQETPLHRASYKGQTKTVKFLIDYNASLNEKTIPGHTPLHIASALGRMEIVKLLIDNNASINEKTNLENTPLHLALAKNQTAIAKLLIEKNASINEKDQHGNTPLHTASQNGQIEIVKLLIDNNASINEKDPHGNTPLRIALNKNQIEIAKLLINNNASL